MAGIELAEKWANDNNDKGLCIARGVTTTKEDFIIVLTKSEETITVFDYGSDIVISEDVEEGSLVELKVVDDYSAVWGVKNV